MASLHLMFASAMALAARSMPDIVAFPRGKSFVAHSSDLIAMKSTPINPDWIVAGDPQARTVNTLAATTTPR